MTPAKIKVLIVDDTAVSRMLLTHLLSSDPQMQVLGTATDGQAALDYLAHNEKPDVMIMDIHMPKLDGFETTRRIMETQPLPIVICSATLNASEVATAFRAMEAGAVACVAKPVAYSHPEFESLSRHLLQTVKLMSEVKVVRRWPRNKLVPAALQPKAHWTHAGVKLVGIGASTGGPPVLQTILAGLPKDFPVPLLIVQHIARGFLPGFVDWLNQGSSLSVQIAAHGTQPLAGHAYVAPDDFHLGVDTAGRLLLTRTEPENGLRPAVSHLFRTLAEVYGPAALGVLLTGMGKDGAAELKLMKDRGADTIAQDRESSIVHGMPGAAIELGGATHVLSADKIAAVLQMLVRSRNALREQKL